MALPYKRRHHLKAFQEEVQQTSGYGFPVSSGVFGQVDQADAEFPGDLSQKGREVCTMVSEPTGNVKGPGKWMKAVLTIVSEPRGNV